MITNHTQILNALIEQYSLKSYLEIGVQNPANNFDKINCCIKIGVDPETDATNVFKIKSDDYFKKIDGIFSVVTGKTTKKFDLIFIDGLHYKEQVKRDFDNSLRCLSDNGFILIHDCLPENEEGTKVPRETKVWWGDVYKFCMTLNSYDGIKYKTFNIDNGCCLVWKDKDAVGGFERKDIDYDYYLKFGKDLMNVTDEVVI